MENNWNEPQVALPNATVVLVLGIISIVGCCCSYGTVGIICGIIALVLAKSANDLYLSDPQRYTQSSYQNVKTGRTCAWIGLIPSILSLIFMIYLVSIFGFAMFTDPSVIYDYFGVQPPF
jgi:hypothetical protein